MPTITGTVSTPNYTGQPDADSVLASIEYELKEWYSANLAGGVDAEMDEDSSKISFYFEVEDHEAARQIAEELEGSLGEGESNNATWTNLYRFVTVEDD